MNKTIWKFPLDLEDSQIIDIPIGAKFLTAQVQGCICIWAVVDPGKVSERRRILIRGTGHPFTGSEERYIGTVMDRAFVWHVFDGGPEAQ